ncbi:unnamed protein product, partial [Mesorhabditis spiculigera]
MALGRFEDDLQFLKPNPENRSFTVLERKSAPTAEFSTTSAFELPGNCRKDPTRLSETAIGEELGDMPEMAEIEDDVIVDVAEEGELDDEDDDDFSDYEDEEMEDEAETSETRQGQA